MESKSQMEWKFAASASSGVPFLGCRQETLRWFAKLGLSGCLACGAIGLITSGLVGSLLARDAGPPRQEKSATEKTMTESQSTTALSQDEPTSTEKPKVKFDLNRKSSDPIQRAKRPDISEAQRKIFFKDFYKEALVGPAPDWSKMGAGPTQTLVGNSNGNISNGDSAGSGVFDALISAAVIEDEIKKAATDLTTKITTPVKFKSDYRDVHQSYSQLATLFAINEAYQGEVRWHDDAAAFRELLGKTAAGTRVSTPQAYQLAVQTRDDLQQIIRGGRANVTASGESLEDWGEVVDRTPMMTWLDDLTQEKMKSQSSNVGDIKKNEAEILREAELVAAIAQVLLQPEMDDHSDGDYMKHAQAMKQSALDIKSALGVQNFEGVQEAMNVMNQSCDDCHGDFR